MNIPNMLTLGRVAAVPLIAALLYAPPAMLPSSTAQALATALFVAAAITDYLDGMLARRLGQSTPFGAFLDPVADKLMVCVCLILLVELGRLSAVIAVVIIARELAVSALREWMAQLGQVKVVAVAAIAKWKTAAQLVGIPLLMCEVQMLGTTSLHLGKFVMWVATALALWSMAGYVRAAAMRLSPARSVQ